MSGLFGDMFDFDHDGEMDSFEKAAEFNFMEDLLDDERSERRENSAIYLTMMTKTTTMISDLSFTKRPFCRSLMLL